MGNLARDVLFRMPARDVIHYSRSPTLTSLMHRQAETALTNPIEYMYPPKWLRSLFMTRGHDSANCTWNMHVDTRIVCCDTYSFFSKEKNCGKWDDHLGEWNKLMYSDCRGCLEHKGSFGFMQNSEKILQVACVFFSPRHPMRKIKPSYSIFNIYRHACKNSHVVIISFLFTVHYR